jgi:putative ABC transport system permease protein
MSFLALTLRNVIRRPLRASLAAGGVALSVASFIALIGLARGHARAWERTLAGQGTDVVVARRGAVELMSTSLDQSLDAQLASVVGVRDAAGELLDLVALDSGETVVFSGRSTESFLWRSLALVAGELPSDREPRGVAIGKGLADALGVGVGGRVQAEGGELVVTGVVRPVGALTSHMVLLPLPRMQAMFHRKDVVTIFNLRLESSMTREETAACLATLARRFPNLTFTEAHAIADENPILRLADGLAWSVSVVALLIGLAGVLNTLLMSVTERVREIGLLSAVGWKASRVVALIVCEGLVLTSVGGVAGALGGIGALDALASVPRVAGLIEPAVTLRLVLEVIAAAVALGALGSLYPAWHAAHLRPVEALKHE